jgi:carbamoyltransferase
VPTRILGISAFYHDSAAALVVDGNIVAAAQEERFTRRKHDPGFPKLAVDYCLREAGLSPADIDYVVFYEKPMRKFERLIETYLAFAPQGFKSFAMAIPVWLKEKTHLSRVIRQNLDRSLKAPIIFTDHHESHAASAFFPSPFAEAAILTLDGVGEWSTTTFGVGRGNRVELTRQIQFPHSLGLLYSAVTYYCGFRVNSGEYKLMGLAPYGRPIYKDLILKHLIDLRPDGSFWLDMQYFNYCQGLTMTNDRFHDLFGAPPRNPESDIEQRHMDLASSIQAVTEDAMLAIGREVHRETGMKNLVLAGGVALNCVANGRLLREGPFDDIWIQPAAGDAGGALGAALFIWYQLLENPRSGVTVDRQKGSYLGPRFDSQHIRTFLDGAGAKYRRAASEAELVADVAALLEQEKIVGWFQGRMEFGPRALGARSIIGDPRSAKMQATMNLKIKFRESFRPFAPIVLRDEAHRWFGIDERHESPYMLLVAPVLDRHRIAVTEEQRETMRNDPDLRNRVNIPRSAIPAVTHVDYSARLQTVDDGRNPRLAALLRAFQTRTGCPILVNTSFNVRGEPIVCTPEDAYRCFLGTEMDVLVLEDAILLKDDVEQKLDTATREKYLSQFQLD